MVLELECEHDSLWAAVRSIAVKIGCSAETLRRWVRAVERDTGGHPYERGMAVFFGKCRVENAVCAKPRSVSAPGPRKVGERRHQLHDIDLRESPLLGEDVLEVPAQGCLASPRRDGDLANGPALGERGRELALRRREPEDGPRRAA